MVSFKFRGNEIFPWNDWESLHGVQDFEDLYVFHTPGVILSMNL